MDRLVGLLDTFYDALGLIFFAFFGGIIRTIYRPQSRKVSAYLLSVIISVPVGVLAANIGLEFGLSENTAKALAVVAGIVAHDLIESVFWTVDKIRAERESLWSAFVRFIAGKFEKGDKDQ